MAANDILAALLQGAGAGGRTSTGDSSLNSFLNTVAENDIYRQIADPLSKVEFDYTGMSNAGRAGLGFGQAFISGLLNEYGKKQEGEQLQKVAQILPQLYANPQGVEAPKGVDTQAFQQLKLGELANEFKRSIEKKEKLGDLEGNILRDLFSNKPALAMQALGIGAPMQPSPSPQIENLQTDNPLAQSGLSTQQKYAQYVRENLAIDDKMTPTEASRAARERLAGEIKANARTIDEAKEARARGLELLDLAQKAKAGIGKAGYTGGFYPVARLYEELANLFGSDEAARQLAGDAQIKGIAPDQVQTKRWPGALAVKEMETILGAGVSLRNTPEENQELADNVEYASTLMLDYADFIDSFKEANAGSTANADKLWAEYKRNVPLFDESNNLIKERPSWQDYFSSKKASSLRVDSDEGVSKEDQQILNQFSEEQLRSFAIEAKRLGLSKEQAQKKLLKISRGE